MRFRTLEIRWHDSKPISTCDFQPVPFKKARPPAGQEKNYAGQSYRLATGGEDNHVRLWMVHPNIRPANLVDELDQGAAVRPPRVEYLATLSRHSAAVNVVRFSPTGEHIASAGDDGMIIIWAPSSTPQSTTYGSDLSAEDLQHEKEYWKPRTSFRCTTMQVYDLAWSPTGEYIIAGSTDNTARVFSATDGKCVHEIAEHSHFVQGVAWDPLNEYIATQSSDRSMHIYRISTKNGTFEAHAIGKNTRMPHRHSRTPSVTGRPRLFQHQHHDMYASDSESAIADDSGNDTGTAPLTPAMSVASNPSSTSMFPPPPSIEASSRRSSFSGSNAPGSPSTFSRYGRSPSPMPPLPAIRSLPPSAWSSVKLYGDESYTNFFRRLTFSPDGGLLLTPAGQFEDPSIIPGKFSGKDDTPARGRKGRPGDAGPSSGPSSTPAASSGSTSSSSVFIYSRANFARPPIAQLPGHKKASVAVRFSPILYELRPNVEGAEPAETKTAALEKGLEGEMDVDVLGPVSGSGPVATAPTPSSESSSGGSLLMTPQRTPQVVPVSLAAPAPKLAISTGGSQGQSGAPASQSGSQNSNANVKASPMISPMDLRPPTPAASKPSTPITTTNPIPLPPPSAAASQTPHHHQHSHSVSSNHGGSGNTTSPPKTGAIFALPYRMLYAVVTMDTITVYDTQQAGPVALLTKLHYDEFTDMSWSPDGQCLMLSSRDGYCTIIIFDEILPSHHTQQHALQIQSIAQHHAVPLLATTSGTGSTPSATPLSLNIGLPAFNSTGTSSSTGQSPQVIPRKRADPPLTPAASVDGGDSAPSSSYFPAGQSSGSGASRVVSAPTAAGGDAEKEAGAPPAEVVDKLQEPPKKKRRVALTRVGDLEP